MLYTKGETVKYANGDEFVLAIVRTRHLDGTATVEAQHFITAEGEKRGPYLGYCYRLPVSALRYAT